MAKSTDLRPKLAGVKSARNSAAHRPIRIALVENQAKIRESWVRRINAFPDLACVCACGSAEEALAIIPQKLPDVVLMDVFLPRRSGIECTARLKAQLPNLQIVMFTALEHSELLFRSLEAGADGYLLKRTRPAALRKAIREVFGGGVPMSLQISRRLIERFRGGPKSPDDFLNLSAREEQMLLHVSNGLSNRMIAQKLDIRPETVSSYMKLILKKLQVKSRTAAVIRYLNSKPTLQRLYACGASDWF